MQASGSVDPGSNPSWGVIFLQKLSGKSEQDFGILELISKIGDIKFFWNVLKAMYILKGPLFWQDQRKVSNNCKKIEFQLFSFLEINEFLFHTFVCHHILMKWFIFCRLCLCYCWNIAKNRNLLLFLWFQKIGPFKMYMALRTLQKNFMSPIFDNNSRL